MFSESWQLPNKIKAAVKHTFFDMNISGWLNAEALILLFFSSPCGWCQKCRKANTSNCLHTVFALSLSAGAAGFKLHSNNLGRYQTSRCNFLHRPLGGRREQKKKRKRGLSSLSEHKVYFMYVVINLIRLEVLLVSVQLFPVVFCFFSSRWLASEISNFWNKQKLTYCGGQQTGRQMYKLHCAFVINALSSFVCLRCSCNWRAVMCCHACARWCCAWILRVHVPSRPVHSHMQHVTWAGRKVRNRSSIRRGNALYQLLSSWEHDVIVFLCTPLWVAFFGGGKQNQTSTLG